MLIALSVVCAPAVPAAQQTFTGRLSDSGCAASHQSKAASAQLTDRACLLACINALAKYVLVDSEGQVLPIANQDAMGLPLYAGRPVKITGEREGDAIVVSKVEAIPAHLHIGHVMTNWRDTPGSRGFLPVAVDEARVAVLHAELASKSASLDDIRLHAGHVLHALDPALEPKGPGAGYGVKKATAGAQQHLDFAAKADGATAIVTTRAAEVSSSLASVVEWLGEAIAVAQRIQSATDLADARRSAADLAALTQRISDAGLQPALTAMNLILKAEGLLGAPR
ncbi:MAG TPA: hypothetical protein VK504_04785 [Vicinamibacterales bacterium]|nr:hypothetical protein [Vicinamibacterales bacterium]